jgi:hypothetical protein
MKPPLSKKKNQLQMWQADLMDFDFILKKARESGFLKRFKKLNPGYLLIVLVFGISCHSKPTCEEIYRLYIKLDDTIHKNGKIRIQSFVKRVNENLGNFLLIMLNHYIDLMLTECPARLKNPVSSLKDILLYDSSIIRLSSKLAGIHPAVRSNGEAAGLKIHAVYSAISHSLKSVLITGERIHDSKIMKIGLEIKNKLLIFDLGYYSILLFAKIQNCGGFFVSRLKTNATPKIESIITASRSVKRIFEKEMLLHDLLKKIPKKGEIDLICIFTVIKASKDKKPGMKRSNLE